MKADNDCVCPAFAGLYDPDCLPDAFSTSAGTRQCPGDRVLTACCTAISISSFSLADIATVHLLSEGISLQSTYFLAMIAPSVCDPRTLSGYFFLILPTSK
jgi:hypothetical protein